MVFNKDEYAILQNLVYSRMFTLTEVMCAYKNKKAKGYKLDDAIEKQISKCHNEMTKLEKLLLKMESQKV